jgi:hypothetical protein
MRREASFAEVPFPRFQFPGGAKPASTRAAESASVFRRQVVGDPDRMLMEEVFEDPLTAQNLEQLEASTSLRKREVVSVKARRRQGPYSVPVRGSSASVTDVAIRAFFPPENRQVAVAATTSE